MLPVGLPFFVEATIADEYLASDHPIIRLRAFGSALKAADPVTFTVAAPVARDGVDAGPRDRVRRTSRCRSRRCRSARQTLTIRTRAAPANGAALADRLVRTFGVVRSRLDRAARSISATRDRRPPPPGGPDFTDVHVQRRRRGQFVSLLQELAAGRRRAGRSGACPGDGPRHSWSPSSATTRPPCGPASFDPARPTRSARQENDEGNLVSAGIPLVPYGGPDAALAAKIALIAPDRFDRSALSGTRWSPSVTCRRPPGSSGSPSWPGWPGSGEPVLADLRSVAGATDLTIRERIDLALGFQAAGDDAAALAIERDLLAQYGQRSARGPGFASGPHLDDTVEATADLALVAAGIGDPVAASLAAYVDANPARTRSTCSTRSATSSAPSPGRRAPRPASPTPSTGSGVSSTSRPAGRSRSRSTASQRDGLRLEPLSGQVDGDRELERADRHLPRSTSIRPSSSPGRSSRPARSRPTGSWSWT